MNLGSIGLILVLAAAVAIAFSSGILRRLEFGTEAELQFGKDAPVTEFDLDFDIKSKMKKEEHKRRKNKKEEGKSFPFPDDEFPPIMMRPPEPIEINDPIMMRPYDVYPSETPYYWPRKPTWTIP